VRVAALQEGAREIVWVVATHDRFRVRGQATDGEYQYEFLASGGAYLIRREMWRRGELVESAETMPARLVEAESLWADLVNGRAR
jgi:hypothetical protein